MAEFRVHDVIWNDTKINNFWDWISKNKHANWFTKLQGKSIITYVRQNIPLKGNILDYGSGKGYLLSYLMDYNVRLFGCDFSRESIDYIKNKFNKFPKFENALFIRKFPTKFKDGQFDIVFLIETIEHLTDAYYDSTLNEIHRILKKGGHIIITTPNSEDLTVNRIICPDCGGVFHMVQHLKSFTSFELAAFTSGKGFTTIRCEAVNFEHYNAKSRLRRLIKKILMDIISKNRPHLVYIGQKND
ncbi:MAG: class I SAM-dependent methyltransferase [Spirochaetes bacterium]|nr:class I SAM-dependent methyltransferase [Spirochaetota bacterium]